MSSLSLRIPEISEASIDEKLALIDELWEAVRRSGIIQMRTDHIQELEKRVAAVSADLSIVLSPAQARAQLKK